MVAISVVRPIDGPPISSHERATPIRKHTITSAAMAWAELVGSKIVWSPYQSLQAKCDDESSQE